MNRINNLTGIFHLLIIAMFLLSLSACGYKAVPFYSEDAPKSDENVEFILEQKSLDNNESCEK